MELYFILALYDLLRKSEVLFFQLNVKGVIIGSLKWHLKLWHHMTEDNESQGTERKVVCLLTLEELAIFKESQSDMLADIR